MSDKEKDTSSDILDEVKRVEKIVKANLLVKAIEQLKNMSRTINELKEHSKMTLEEIGLSEKDIKRVIDFIGESSDVKLTDEDRKDIRSVVRSKIKDNKEIAREKIDSSPAMVATNSSNLVYNSLRDSSNIINDNMQVAFYSSGEDKNELRIDL